MPRPIPTRSASPRPSLGAGSGSSGPPLPPQTNGKVERFNRTLLEEWAYERPYHSNAERRRAFARWLGLYSHRRPHGALDGLSPMAVLINNASGNHS
jgi:transposase InsO family protein